MISRFHTRWRRRALTPLPGRGRPGSICWLILALCFATASFAGIPPIPKDFLYVQDYAGIVPQQARDRIGRIQQQAFVSNDTPIMVVTVRSMADYGHAGSTTENFAREWFNAWQIGMRKTDGTLVNRGMLLLVSVGDRKARIELGADWGHDADGFASSVMDNGIIPSFKQGRFDEGILNGVQSLARLAEGGPGHVPYSGPLAEAVPKIIEQVTGPGEVTTSPLPKHIIFSVSAIGVFLVALAFVLPGQRKFLLIAGLSLILIVWFFWIALAILAVFAKGKGRSGGGYGSSGGFGSGGFSGGGGASGSW